MNVSLSDKSTPQICEAKIEINIPKHSIVAIELTGDLNLKSAEVDFSKLKPGLSFNFYEGEFNRLPDFYEIEPKRSGSINNVIYPEGTPANNFGLTYEVYIKIDKEGLYEFYLTSDDGSKLSVDNKEIVMNDGLHAMVEKSGTLFLSEGYHKIDISFFQRSGGSGLNLKMKTPDGEKEEVKNEIFFHVEK